MFLKETIRVHRNAYQKEADVQISKRRCTVGSCKGEVEQLHPLFFLSEQDLGDSPYLFSGGL
jgi:hypothetical protein